LCRNHCEDRSKGKTIATKLAINVLWDAK